jgi:CRISPR system Cascade subunit CasB
MSKPNEREKAFVARLEKLAAEGDRGALAALRRGLGKPPGTTPEMYPFMERWLPQDSEAWRDDGFYTVAALFAFHQGSWRSAPERQPTNMGASFARLAMTTDSESIEKRFVALLNCHREDLHVHLRHAVGLLKSKEVPVDWAQLLADVRAWSWEKRPVQRAWAKAFWAQGGRGETVAAAAQEE